MHLFFVGVRCAVELDDQFFLRTEEVGDVGADRSLPAKAESGELKNFLDGEYQSAGKIDLLAYRTNEPAYKPGTSLLGTKPGTAPCETPAFPSPALELATLMFRPKCQGSHA